MGFKYTDAAFKTKAVKGMDKYVLLLICERANNDTGVCWPSMRTIAEDGGISKDTVLRSVRLLAEKAIIKIVVEGHERKSNRYQVDMSSIKDISHEEVMSSNKDIVMSSNKDAASLIYDAASGCEDRTRHPNPSGNPEASEPATKEEEEEEEEGAPFATLTTPQAGNASEQIDQDFEALLAEGSPVALINESWMRHTGLGLLPTEWLPAKEFTGHWGVEATLSYLDDTFACPKTSKVAWRNFDFWVSRFIQTKANIDAWRRANRGKHREGLPRYRRIDGKEATKNSEILRF